MNPRVISLLPKLATVKRGEMVVFSWITYKSKADAKRIMKKVMADPRLTTELMGSIDDRR